VAEPPGIWIGTEEFGGVPTPTVREAKPPPHWRLEAIAATERPRSLELAPDGRILVFIQDRDTSDLWTLSLDSTRDDPRRLTTGRDPAPYWEDTTPAVSPDGSRVAYADDGVIWLASVAGGPPQRVLDAGSPVWLDERRLVVSVERDDTSRLAVLDVEDPWPRRLAVEHGALDTFGEEGSAAVSPDGSLVAYSFAPRADLNRSEIRVVSVETGEVRSLSGAAAIHDRSPRWSPDGARVAFASGASGWYELHVVTADGSETRQLTHELADFHEHRWHPAGDRLVATRACRGRFDLVLVDADSGVVTEIGHGGTWGEPLWTATGAVVATYEDQSTAPELRLVHPGAEPETLLAPAPLAIECAPHAVPETVTYTSFDGLEIEAYLFRPAGASAQHPAPAVVYPHGGPLEAYGDYWDGHAQYFVDKGYAWIAPNYRGSTGYGRDFERLLHGQIGVVDTKDCLAAADFLRSLDWVDGDRLAIFGASWGSFISLLAVTDDSEHRFRCAVCKYGDCDMLTSWSQGDRSGVLESLENFVGPPSAARDAYAAASAVQRLENVRVPILVAHGEKDERVHPKQSEELIAELRRLGKTYEYVTYPTEGHGLFRAGPQIDFYRRLERFLDWYLL
jgi:dipeptidyl aminopeptidase/acylaminoacyl peptidase